MTANDGWHIDGTGLNIPCEEISVPSRENFNDILSMAKSRFTFSPDNGGANQIMTNNLKEENIMNPVFMKRDGLEAYLENRAADIRFIMEEFSRRDAGRDVIDHHTHGLDEMKHMEVTGKTDRELASDLDDLLREISYPSLVWETRFKDATYTKLIYDALEPLSGRS